MLREEWIFAMQERAFFIGFILFFLWIFTTTFVLYLTTRKTHIEGNPLWRSFFGAFVSGFLLLIAVSVTRNSIGANLFIWFALYAVISFPVLQWALRINFTKAIIPWAGAVLCLGFAFLAWHFFADVLMDLLALCF
jgi:hypothetical protein